MDYKNFIKDIAIFLDIEILLWSEFDLRNFIGDKHASW